MIGDLQLEAKQRGRVIFNQNRVKARNKYVLYGSTWLMGFRDPRAERIATVVVQITRKQVDRRGPIADYFDGQPLPLNRLEAHKFGFLRLDQPYVTNFTEAVFSTRDRNTPRREHFHEWERFPVPPEPTQNQLDKAQRHLVLR